MTATRPAKQSNVKKTVTAAVSQGHIRYSTHALERMEQRKIVGPEVLHVLVNGFHEARKDEYKEDHKTWTYAIRGKTVDGRNLRFGVAILSPDVLLITAIDLDKGE